MVDQSSFETKVNAFRIYKEDVQQAYNVFKLKGKAKVISRNFLNNTVVSDFLVQSDVMKTYLQNIGLRIKNLLLEEKNDSLGFFYFAQYGGSKSQFIELLKDDLIRRGEKDSEFDSNKLIFLHFPGIVDISGENIFNQLIEGGIRGIARGVEKDDKYSQIFSQIKEMMLKTQLGILGSDKKEEISKDLSIIRQKGNYEIKTIVERIETNLQYVQFMDDELILSKCIEIMELLSKKGFVFVWFFDELDQWFASDTSKLSLEFQKKSRLFKSIFDLGAHCKIVFYFASTDRVQVLFNDLKNVEKLRTADAAISRFFVLRENADSRVEHGYYGDMIDKAVLHFSAMKFVLNGGNFPSNEFYDFLDRIIEFFQSSEYSRWDRRGANTEILRVLDSYFILKDALHHGFEEMKRASWLHLGNIIPKKLATIFKNLGVFYQFTRTEIKVGTKRLDGQFDVSRSGDNDILVECKLGKDLSSLKVEQVFEATQVTSQYIIFLVFGQFSKERVKERLKNYFIDKAEEDAYKRTKTIVINNDLAFASILGLDHLTRLKGIDELTKIHEACADFLDIFSDIHVDLTAVFNQHRMFFPKEYPTEIEEVETEEVEIKEKQSVVEEFVKEKIPKTPEDSQDNVIEQLEAIDQLVLTLLKKLKKDRKFTPSGRKTVSHITNNLKNDKTGLINNLSRIGNRLNQLDLLETKTDKTWKFSPFINELGNDRSIKIREFEEQIIKEIIKNKPKKSVLNL